MKNVTFKKIDLCAFSVSVRYFLSVKTVSVGVGIGE